MRTKISSLILIDNNSFRVVACKEFFKNRGIQFYSFKNLQENEYMILDLSADIILIDYQLIQEEDNGLNYLHAKLTELPPIVLLKEEEQNVENKNYQHFNYPLKMDALFEFIKKL